MVRNASLLVVAVIVAGLLARKMHDLDDSRRQEVRDYLTVTMLALTTLNVVS